MNPKYSQEIDAYIAQYPTEIQAELKQIRELIHHSHPDITEKISYGMPTFFLRRNLVHFAVNKHHIGFYPAPSGIAAFAEELQGFKTSKGAIQFPLKQAIPFELVAAIVAFRVEENLTLKK